MEHYKISIVVPVYNTEHYLPACVDSLLRQTLPDIQIILVDDGSTDNSGRMCDQYGEAHKNVLVLHQENQGQSSARNEGIRAAGGEYLMFVDSDDYITDDACEVFYTAAKAEDLDIVWGDILNDPRLSERKAYSPDRIMSGQAYLRYSLEHQTYDITPWIRMVRTSFFLQHSLFFPVGLFYEDQLYTLQLLLPESRLRKIYHPFYYYRPNPNSTTHTPSAKKARDILEIIRRMSSLIQSSRVSPDLMPYLQGVSAVSFYHFSSVFVQMTKQDRKTVRREIDPTVRQCARQTSVLPRRMKIQNRLMLYCPEVLSRALSLIRNIRRSMLP